VKIRLHHQKKQIMGQSLSKLYVHMVFHIKNPLIPIHTEIKDKLYAYMGSIIKDNDSLPIMINGVPDHVHILCVMSKNIALAKLLEEVKGHSSRWIKTLDSQYRFFAWQGGNACFSISQCLKDRTIQYINNQEEHHRKVDYKEEMIQFMKEYGIEYDDRYFWRD